MAESKTARASAVKQTEVKKVIPDVELLRLLRIDRASGIYPGVQGTDAALRALDEATSANVVLAGDLLAARKQLVDLEAQLVDRERIIRDGLAVLNEHLTGRTYDELGDAIRNMLQAYVTTRDNLADTQHELDQLKPESLSETLQAELEPLPAAATNDLNGLPESPFTE